MSAKGKTTVATDVLLTIARLTALQVPGVSRMGNVPAGARHLLNRNAGEGVRIEIKDDKVNADLYLILEKDVNIREVSRQVQHDVARAITEMVGMEVERVDIHIEDIDFPNHNNDDAQTEAKTG